jgi:hypothetical protein
MSQNRLDLNKLPYWLQCLIGVIAAVLVGGAGWYVGRDNPVPHWIQRYLIPGLAWFGLLLIVLAVVDWIRRRR